MILLYNYDTGSTNFYLHLHLDAVMCTAGGGAVAPLIAQLLNNVL